MGLYSIRRPRLLFEVIAGGHSDRDFPNLKLLEFLGSMVRSDFSHAVDIEKKFKVARPFPCMAVGRRVVADGPTICF